MGDQISNQEKRSIGLSAGVSILGSLVVIVPALWFIARPVLVSSISDAMATDIEEIVDNKVAPIQGGFKVLIQRNIDTLRREISSLEFRRTNAPESWTQIDATDLAQKRIDLDAQQEALRALQ